MYKFEKEMRIRNFIYDKIEKGYTVRKTGKDTYEFKIKTEKIKVVNSSNFLTDFVKIK